MIKNMFIIAFLTITFNPNVYAKEGAVVEHNNVANQEVSWPGFVSQSFINQGLLCYEVIKTLTYKNNKPIPGQLIDDSRYISCAESKKDISKSNNRYVTVSGKIIGSIGIDGHEYPVIMADKVRKWHFMNFSDKGVGTIKPRLDRSRMDFVLNQNGL